MQTAVPRAAAANNPKPFSLKHNKAQKVSLLSLYTCRSRGTFSKAWVLIIKARTPQSMQKEKRSVKQHPKHKTSQNPKQSWWMQIGKADGPKTENPWIPWISMNRKLHLQWGTVARDIACQPKVWNSNEGGASFIKGSLFRRANWRGPLLPPACVFPLPLPKFSDFDILCFLLRSSCCLPSTFLVHDFEVCCCLTLVGVLSHPSFAQDWLSCHVSWSFSSLLEIGYCNISDHFRDSRSWNDPSQES